MKVVLAKTAGFCYGVKRAINIAFDATKKGSDDIYTLGPIIHNPQVVEKLKCSGVRPVDSVYSLDTGTVILRSHGVEKNDLKEIKNRSLSIIDATCPFVKKAQGYAQSLSVEGYKVIVVGDADHPEVRSILSYVSGESQIISNTEEVKKVKKTTKIGVIAQTTQSIDNFIKIASELIKKSKEIKIFNTICDTTTIRQLESIELAKKVDCMIIIGGKNSANTKRLALICKEINPKSYHIEVAQDIDFSWFFPSDVIGVTAGASTPDWVIKEVVDKLTGGNN